MGNSNHPESDEFYVTNAHPHQLSRKTGWDKSDDQYTSSHNKLFSPAKGYTCGLCANFNPGPTRWNCGQCNYDLCNPCKIADEIRPLHEHDLVLVPTKSKIARPTPPSPCARCKESKLEGYYWCKPCKYVLCETCYFISTPLLARIPKLVPSHAHPLICTVHSDGGYETGYQCDGCAASYKNHIRWHCASCQYDLCNTCLPIVVQTPLPLYLTPQNQQEKEKSSGDLAPTASSSSSVFDPNQYCVVCLDGPKNSAFIHGGTGHVCCCLPCAKKVKEVKRVCPICTKSIDSVVELFFN